MALFGKKKKKTGGCCDMEIVPDEDTCDCGGNCAPAEDAPCCTPEEAKESGCCCGDADNSKIIKILGTGCTKCNNLTDNAKAAIEKLGGGYTIEKVTEITDIAAYGAVQTPAMVLGNKVVSKGKVLSTDEIVKILEVNK